MRLPSDSRFAALCRNLVSPARIAMDARLMHMRRPRFLSTLLLALALAAMPAPHAFGQAYPAKPIRMITGYAPGGTSDILARLIAQELGKALGQPIIVDNRPGAGGNIGTDLV